LDPEAPKAIDWLPIKILLFVNCELVIEPNVPPKVTVPVVVIPPPGEVVNVIPFTVPVASTSVTVPLPPPELPVVVASKKLSAAIWYAATPAPALTLAPDKSSGAKIGPNDSDIVASKIGKPTIALEGVKPGGSTNTPSALLAVT